MDGIRSFLQEHPERKRAYWHKVWDSGEDLTFLEPEMCRLQKSQIISDLLCYGSCPEPDDPVEQRLTISSTGRIWFTERIFGPLGYTRYPIGRKIQLSIGKERATAILSKLADYSESEPPLIYCTDVGNWYMTLTDADGSNKKLSCSMNGNVFVGDIYLNDFIRARIPIDGLAVFGGEDIDEED